MAKTDYQSIDVYIAAHDADEQQVLHYPGVKFISDEVCDSITQTLERKKKSSGAMAVLLFFTKNNNKRC